MNIYLSILLLIISYLLGSIPFALITGKLVKKLDLREHGSKNLGATNTFRVLGLRWGILVMILDTLKAALIVIIVQHNLFNIKDQVFHPLIYGLTAIIGHMFPIYCNFKGGKGVSCTAGVVIAFNPFYSFFALIAFIVTILITKIVSISSLVSVTAVLIGAIIQICIDYNLDSLMYLILAIISFTFLFYSHRQNIIRLIKHQETKVTDIYNSHHKK